MSIRLKPGQEEHFSREREILEHSFFLMNESGTGEGKTYTTCKLIQHYGFASALVICPATICEIWDRMRKMYGIPIVSIISYQSLCSRRGSQPTHGYLKRIDNDDDTTSYEVLPKYTDLVAKGMMLIFDEAQYAKNDTLTSNSISVLARYISRNPGQSRVVLLSATPFDKMEQVNHLFKTIGLYSLKNGLFIQPIIDLANKYDATTTEMLLQNASRDRGSKGIDMISLCYQLYINVIRRFVCTAMISPNKSVRVNFYAKLPYGIDTQYVEAVNELHNAVASRRNRTACAPILSKIQTLKMYAVIRLTEKKLQTPPRRDKIIIFASYLEAIRFAADKLAQWNPLVITGEIRDMKKRHNMIASFQSPSSSHRLLIINSAVGSVGLSLDDTHGKWPRTAYVMPDYNIMRMHQIAGRIDRINTRSCGEVYVIYGQGPVREVSILNSLSRKTTVLIDTQPDHVRGGIIYPGDYPDITEA